MASFDLNERLSISSVAMIGFVLLLIIILVSVVVGTIVDIKKKVDSLTNAANVALMVTSAAKGVTQGLGDAIGSITCRDRQDAPRPKP